MGVHNPYHLALLHLIYVYQYFRNNITEVSIIYYFPSSQMLLCAGAAVDSSGESKMLNPLHLALKFAANSVVRILLEFGANPDAVDKQGEAPIHHAIALGQVNLATALLIVLSRGLVEAGLSMRLQNPTMKP